MLYFQSGIIPKPNTADGYTISSASAPVNVVDTVVRIDHKINDKWQIMGHYIHNALTQSFAVPYLGWSSANFNTVTSQLTSPSSNMTVKVIGEIAPNLLLEASLNYDSDTLYITNSSNSLLPSGWSVNRFFNNGSTSMPSINGWSSPYNVAEDMGSAPWHNGNYDYSPKADISYTKGKHATKFGLGYNSYITTPELFGQRQGNYSFGTHSGDSLMDMLLGIASSYNQVQAAPFRHYVNQTVSFYAMDNWHITPRLTVQYGLRYDALPHALMEDNQIANFDPTTYQASLQPTWNSNGSMDPTGPGFYTIAGATQPFYLNGMGLAGQNGIPRGLVNNDYATLQPRIGFSEDMFGTGKTVLRGGFGTFYERLQGNDIYNVATNAPFFNNPGANNIYFSNPRTSWVTGQTATLPFFPQGMTSLARHYPAPAVAMYSFGIQHEVAPSVILIVQYVGNMAWHQNIDRNINNFPLDTNLSIRANAGDPNNVSGTNPGGTNLANSNLYRTYQGFGGIAQEEDTTNGNYNGFQAGVRVQNRWGLSGELDYTYSHEIDITSNDLQNVSNPFNLKYDKGSGALDRRQIVNANYVYNLPIFTKSKGLAHSLLGGWQLAGTTIFETGIPQASRLSLAYDPIGLGGGYNNRPNVNGKVTYKRTQKSWFNTAQFSAPLPAWAGGQNQGFGDAGKDAIKLPGRTNFTTSLYKSFAITEAAHFEFRAESFNTFNTFQYNGVNASFGNSQFGQVTSANDPRVLELGGKIVF